MCRTVLPLPPTTKPDHGATCAHKEILQEPVQVPTAGIFSFRSIHHKGVTVTQGMFVFSDSEIERLYTYQ